MAFPFDKARMKLWKAGSRPQYRKICGALSVLVYLLRSVDCHVMSGVSRDRHLPVICSLSQGMYVIPKMPDTAVFDSAYLGMFLTALLSSRGIDFGLSSDDLLLASP